MRDADPGRAAREITAAITALLDPDRVASASANIARALADSGVTFEGRTVGVSLFPSVFHAGDVVQLERRTRLVREVLMRVIQRFRTEHHERQYDGPLHRAFAPYEPWWDAIASERRALPEIGLMRYDFIIEAPGVWSVLETNTACPGGTTICASVRDAWLGCGPIGDVAAVFDVLRFPVDDPTSFVRYLYQTACHAAGADDPGIAVLNDSASLTFELDLWASQHERLRRAGVVKGDFLVADIRDVEVVRGRAWVRGTEVALIHNKVNPIEVRPSDPAVAGWLEASRTPGVAFLNSMGAMYLTEAKRVLQLICMPEIRRLLAVSPEEAAAIDALMPSTEVIPARGEPGANKVLARLEQDREALVIKPDARTRGQGVYLGRTVPPDQWTARIDETRQHFGVAQRALHVPQAARVDLSDGTVRIAQEYFGADVYYFGDRFAGLSSRAHTHPVFNMGAGGTLRPVLVVRPR
ncbi:MAG TPA: hypothetical protein VFK02_07325 [Kofleriaceae bacterium]|nr:hypothetical protein [Kofleriaceae bacterium]